MKNVRKTIMKDKPAREILFQYFPVNGVTTSLCSDTYNWLLDQNIEIAKKFKLKWMAAENESKEEYKNKRGEV